MNLEELSEIKGTHQCFPGGINVGKRKVSTLGRKERKNKERAEERKDIREQGREKGKIKQGRKKRGKEC